MFGTDSAGGVRRSPRGGGGAVCGSSISKEFEMVVYGHGAQELAIAGSLLAAQLGELLISKGLVTKAEAAAIVAAAKADATAQPTITGASAAKIIEAVGEQWAKSQ